MPPETGDPYADRDEIPDGQQPQQTRYLAIFEHRLPDNKRYGDA
jgi:hypothetical protein